MRAVVLTGGRLEVGEVPDPVPGPGHLLLRTLSCAICASDVHFMDHGAHGDPDDPLFGGYRPEDAIVMGHEFVGVVVGHGSGVDAARFPMGARVTSIPALPTEGGLRIIGQHPDAPGGFGELLLVSQDLARVVPDGVADDAVALVDAFAVGEGYVNLAGMTSQDVPVVIGAGAIGLSAIAALKRRGISPIIVSDFNADRRDLAARFGADVLVDPAEQSPYSVWTQLAYKGRSNPRCVIFECVGAPGIVNKIVADCPHNSLVCCAGGHYTEDAMAIAPATRKGIRLQFGGAPGFDDWYGTLAAVCDGSLDPLPSIGMTIGLDEVPAALDLARKAQGPPRIIVRPQLQEA